MFLRPSKTESYSSDVLQIQAPRISYLPLLLPSIRRHLVDLVLDEGAAATLSDDSLWFEAAGEPWKWCLAVKFDQTELYRHWPIGLLYDYHIASLNLSAKGKSPELPLRVTLHLSSPPTDRLLANPSIETCRSNFMNMVKEADYVRWGSTKRVTALRKVDQDALWDGVVERTCVDFARN